MLGACVRPSADESADTAPAGEAVVQARPSFVLVTVDTLRADHVSSYGYRLPTTPTLDRLAQDGVRFADATVPWPKTWPAVASMMTGKYPATTGVRLYPRRPLPSDHETLAETLGRAGYATAAVVANVNVGREFGFDQGFGRFVEAWEHGLASDAGEETLAHDPGAVKELTGADVVTDRAIEMLDDFGDGRPFFLWLHYIDPHGPYRPPPAYRDLWRGEYPEKQVAFDAIPLYQRQHDAAGAPITDIGHYVASYDREIRFFDDQLRRLLGELSARGLRDDTLMVVTSDHGESLDEDDYLFEHGAAPYQPTAGVPLVVVFPGKVPAGRVVEEPVGLIDLLPTLFDLLRVVEAPPVQGRSLVSSWGDAPSKPAEYVFMESGSYEPSQLSVRKGHWKLARLRAPRDRVQFGRQEFELYDLVADPGEDHDVSKDHPAVVEELRLALETWHVRTPVWEGGEGHGPAPVDEKTHALLRALGYVE